MMVMRRRMVMMLVRMRMMVMMMGSVDICMMGMVYSYGVFTAH
jgi:hypothetical protein